MTAQVPAGVEPVLAFDFPSIIAFTTTRERGDFNIIGGRPAGEVVARWLDVQDELGVARFAYAKQVHGRRVVVHNEGWSGWLRVPDADGHLAFAPKTALAVTLADCVPVFLAHPSGVVGLLHAGWRGVAGGIIDQAAQDLAARGLSLADCHAHLGPAICGKCYEVGPEVIRAVRGDVVQEPTFLDLREVLGKQLERVGVRGISVSEYCTRCHNGRFFSHRAGDAARHIAVVARIA
ncbi:MAG TPA: polyphenol oxidase family protein [Gemmatimonadaceae bacterium]